MPNNQQTIITLDLACLKWETEISAPQLCLVSLVVLGPITCFNYFTLDSNLIWLDSGITLSNYLHSKVEIIIAESRQISQFSCKSKNYTFTCSTTHCKYIQLEMGHSKNCMLDIVYHVQLYSYTMYSTALGDRNRMPKVQHLGRKPLRLTVVFTLLILFAVQ